MRDGWTCPYCKNLLDNVCKKAGRGNHLKSCKRLQGISSDKPPRIDLLEYNFPAVTKEFLEKEIYENEKSILELDTETGCDCRTLAQFYGLRLRRMKESGSTKRKLAKLEETCIKKYGTKNVLSEGSFGRRKRDGSMLDKYGVINFYQAPNFLETVEKTIKDRYGLTRFEWRSKIHKDIWEKKTPEERLDWLSKSILNAKVFNHSSKLELSIVDFLVNNGFEIETQFRIKKTQGNFWFYDIRLKDSNILIEVNGTFWHADPRIYVATDLVGKKGKLAKDIWKHDLEKYNAAKQAGFKVIYLWELDILEARKQDSLTEYLFTHLQEVNYEDYKTCVHQET